MPARKRETDTSVNFEKSLKQLESIVKRLEEEEIPLETSIKLFEEGQGLIKACQQQLRAAENRIRVLTEDKEGTIQESDLGGDEEEDKEEEPADAERGASERTAEHRSSDDDLPF